jgi:hypothetical protein
VVVRELSDAEMLTIGSQENLQRQDLGPLEEAQLIAWHERVFFGKNQAEIGAMLGKSSDWVSVRSRIYRLPDALKARLQQRPRAIAQMLEIATLFSTQPDDAVALADRVVVENLSLDVVRAHIRGYARPERHTPTALSSITPNVPEVYDAPWEDVERQQTSPRPVEEASSGYPREPGEATVHEHIRTDEPITGHRSGTGEAGAAAPLGPAVDDVSDLVLLEEAAAALALIASRSSTLPSGRRTTQVLEQLKRSLAEIQSGFHRASSKGKD